MTPKELEKLRLDARFTAIEAAWGEALSALSHSPAVRKGLLLKLDRLVKTTHEVRGHRTSPELSDLRSGELREAVADLVYFVKKLKPPISKTMTRPAPT